METSIATGDTLAVKKWVDGAYLEYLNKLVTGPYMGTDSSAMIQVNEELTKGKGDAITFSLLAALRGQGVLGDSTLEGNEEALRTFGQQVSINLVRNAVRIAGKLAEQRYPFEIRDKAKPALTDWKAQYDEDKVFEALGSIDGTAYSAAGTSAKNTWNANNSDRVLYGAAVSNYNATHATALGNVDSTNDVLNTAQLTLAKRLAKLCNPKIRPIRLENGLEFFVLFAHPYCTRDLRADSAWKDAQMHAMPRGTENPLFTGAIGYYDGVLVIETERIALLDNVGASSIDVAQNFLCGAQAILWAQGGVGGMRMDFPQESFDYGNQTGVGVESMWGVAKARFGTGASGVNKDHGVLTVFSAAVAD